MLKVVLVWQPADEVLPGPLVDVDRVLGSAAGEEAAVRARLGDPGHGGRARCGRPDPATCGGLRGGQTISTRAYGLDSLLVTDLVPVVERTRRECRVRARLRIPVELEYAGVVDGLRVVWN